MPNKEALLKDLNFTATLLETVLTTRFGTKIAKSLKVECFKEYEKLIPKIPYIKGIQGKFLNQFLLITAQELAVYKAMKKLGKSTKEAWELCHEALKLRMKTIPKWKKWIIKYFMFSPITMTLMKRRAKNREIGRFGDFEIEYLIGDEDDFDFGVNYLQCGNLNFLKNNGGEEFAPYVCMSDIALSDALGWGLTRTQTLADGCDHCDFRFKKGGATKISSKTPDVQKTILDL
ncbi:MAG: L-2-amino-thiazoline-4-carboxylic acid hydrolase [Nitrospinota bacterium]